MSDFETKSLDYAVANLKSGDTVGVTDSGEYANKDARVYTKIIGSALVKKTKNGVKNYEFHEAYEQGATRIIGPKFRRLVWVQPYGTSEKYYVDTPDVSVNDQNMNLNTPTNPKTYLPHAVKPSYIQRIQREMCVGHWDNSGNQQKYIDPKFKIQIEYETLGKVNKAILSKNSIHARSWYISGSNHPLANGLVYDKRFYFSFESSRNPDYAYIFEHCAGDFDDKFFPRIVSAQLLDSNNNFVSDLPLPRQKKIPKDGMCITNNVAFAEAINKGLKLEITFRHKTKKTTNLDGTLSPQQINCTVDFAPDLSLVHLDLDEDGFPCWQGTPSTEWDIYSISLLAKLDKQTKVTMKGIYNELYNTGVIAKSSKRVRRNRETSRTSNASNNQQRCDTVESSETRSIAEAIACSLDDL